SDEPKAVPLSLAKGTVSSAACSILTNGDLKCWGRAMYGMLGNGSESQVGDDPEEIGDGVQLAQLGTGRSVQKLFMSGVSQHLCAKLDNNGLKCWGRNNYGQLGYEDTV